MRLDLPLMRPDSEFSPNVWISDKAELIHPKAGDNIEFGAGQDIWSATVVEVRPEALTVEFDDRQFGYDIFVSPNYKVLEEEFTGLLSNRRCIRKAKLEFVIVEPKLPV